MSTLQAPAKLISAYIRNEAAVISGREVTWNVAGKIRLNAGDYFGLWFVVIRAGQAKTNHGDVRRYAGNRRAASCHGLGGKGGGPAAPELKTTPPDLTQLSKGNGGKFPSAMVSSVIRGDQVLLAHGSREMPIWGEAFRNVNRDETLAKIKVRNLTLYIESIQQK
jgi:hypothetical protein